MASPLIRNIVGIIKFREGIEFENSSGNFGH